MRRWVRRHTFCSFATLHVYRSFWNPPPSFLSDDKEKELVGGGMSAIYLPVWALLESQLNLFFLQMRRDGCTINGFFFLIQVWEYSWRVLASRHRIQPLVSRMSGAARSCEEGALWPWWMECWTVTSTGPQSSALDMHHSRVSLDSSFWFSFRLTFSDIYFFTLLQFLFNSIQQTS